MLLWRKSINSFIYAFYLINYQSILCQVGCFGATLKYIYAHPNLSIDDYQAVSSYLGLDYQAVLFILRVFLN